MFLLACCIDYQLLLLFTIIYWFFWTIFLIFIGFIALFRTLYSDFFITETKYCYHCVMILLFSSFSYKNQCLIVKIWRWDKSLCSLFLVHWNIDYWFFLRFFSYSLYLLNWIVLWLVYWYIICEGWHLVFKNGHKRIHFEIDLWILK